MWKRNCPGMYLACFYNNFLMRITQKWILTYCSILFYFLKWLKYLDKYMNKLAAELWNFKQQIFKFSTLFHLVKALNFIVNIIWTFKQCKFLRLTKKQKEKVLMLGQLLESISIWKFFSIPYLTLKIFLSHFFSDSTTINISTNDM